MPRRPFNSQLSQSLSKPLSTNSQHDPPVPTSSTTMSVSSVASNHPFLTQEIYSIPTLPTASPRLNLSERYFSPLSRNSMTQHMKTKSTRQLSINITLLSSPPAKKRTPHKHHISKRISSSASTIPHLSHPTAPHSLLAHYDEDKSFSTTGLLLSSLHVSLPKGATEDRGSDLPKPSFSSKFRFDAPSLGVPLPRKVLLPRRENTARVEILEVSPPTKYYRSDQTIFHSIVDQWSILKEEEERIEDAGVVPELHYDLR